VIDHYHRLISDFVFKVKDVTSMMPGICRDGAVFETSQGLMIDEHYGTRPHTTRVDTTNNYAIRLTDSLTDDVMLQKIGITKALASRHGMGAFPTEDGSLAAMVCDENQLETFWAGNVRWGWFDAVLTRYAQRVNQVDELYVSCLDYLDRFETIKICQAYSYSGLIDDDFKATFNFEPKASGCIVYDIKRPSEKMSKYLSQCQPIYQTVAGWQQDTTRVKEAQQLPQQCLGYLERITELTGVKVSVVSVGPTRNQKVVIV
jgi:adenylosuccinate synthase